MEVPLALTDLVGADLLFQGAAAAPHATTKDLRNKATFCQCFSPAAGCLERELVT